MSAQKERTEMPASGLALRAARMSRGKRVVLDEVSLALKPGEVCGLLGPNGAGKSTLLGAMAGEFALDSGEVSLDGVPLAALGEATLARRRAVLPQQGGLAFDLGVTEVVAMGGYPFPAVSPAALQALSQRALALADVQALADRRYLELSGGERQRVQCARVLVQCLADRQPGEARYLLLDEPTASLDPLHQQALLGAAQALARSENVAVLVILHDVNLAAQFCDRLVFLAQGRLIVEGAPRAVLRPDILARVYGLPAQVEEVAGRPMVLFGPPAAKA